MPITNFGGLLNFAEEIEKQDMAFYSSVAANPEMSDLSDLFQGFAKDGKKKYCTYPANQKGKCN